MVAFRAFFEFVDFDNILGSSLGSHFAFKLLPDPTFTLLTPKRIIILVYRFFMIRATAQGQIYKYSVGWW